MSIQFSCTCGKSYRVSEKLAGKRATCKACGEKMVIPAPPEDDDDEDLLVVEVEVPIAPTQPSAPQSIQQPPQAPPMNGPSSLAAPSTPAAPGGIPSSPSLPPSSAPPSAEFAVNDPFAPGGVLADGVPGTESPFGMPAPANPIVTSGGDEIDDVVGALGLNEPQHVPVPVDSRERASRDMEHLIQTHGEDFSIGGSQASNPGKLRISPLRYISVFPMWFSIWHGLLLLSILASGFTYCMWPFTLAFGAIVFIYWRNTLNKFYYGNINPGMVVSLDPPLVAVQANMTKMEGFDIDVVRVLPQPLHKMTSGMPTIGQRVGTVAFYEDRFSHMTHWSDFDPTMIDVVTADQAEVQRVFRTIDTGDWQEFDAMLAQVPRPFEAGIYRTFTPVEAQRFCQLSPQQIQFVINKHMVPATDNSFVFTRERGIPPEKLTDASPFLQGVQPQSILALVIPNMLIKPDKGIAFTVSGICYNTQKNGMGRFGWQHIRGAFASMNSFEIVLTNGQRINFKNEFSSNVPGNIDNMINEIVGHYVITPELMQVLAE